MSWRKMGWRPDWSTVTSVRLSANDPSALRRSALRRHRPAQTTKRDGMGAQRTMNPTRQGNVAGLVVAGDIADNTWLVRLVGKHDLSSVPILDERTRDVVGVSDIVVEAIPRHRAPRLQLPADPSVTAVGSCLPPPARRVVIHRDSGFAGTSRASADLHCSRSAAGGWRS